MTQRSASCLSAVGKPRRPEGLAASILIHLRTLILSGAAALAPALGCSNEDARSAGTGGSTNTGGAGGTAGSGGAGGSPGGGGTGGPGTDGGASSADLPIDVPISSPDAGGADATPVSDARPDGDGGAIATMSFFVTSRGLGKGGDLGGLAGADAHCLALAKAVGSTKVRWAAYLSSSGGGTPVHARDRIGSGPWFNARGVMIASSLETLHGNAGRMNAISTANSLDETGKIVPGRIAANRPPGTMNEHDILTGSTVEGMLSPGNTCADWTSSAASGVLARVGHSDKDGVDPVSGPSWNSTHTSGCAEGRGAGTVSSGGGRGSVYCFAAD